MACPNCDSTDIKSNIGKPYKLDGYPEIEVLDIIISCNHCGYGFNCKGTKKVNIE